jgi:hypothetical protein
MAANENTKFQINYKLSDGTLINLYATDVKDLETGLTDLSMVSALITSTAKELGNTPVASRPDIQAIAQQFNATPIAVNAQPDAPGSKTCKHGPMAFKSGTSPKGPWQGYMCNTPKGSPDKCETIWVR